MRYLFVLFFSPGSRDTLLQLEDDYDTYNAIESMLQYSMTVERI